MEGSLQRAPRECARVGLARSGRPLGLWGSARRRVAPRARTRSFVRRGPARSAPARPDRGRRGHRPVSQPSRRTPHLGRRSPRVPLSTPPRPGCDADPFPFRSGRAPRPCPDPPRPLLPPADTAPPPPRPLCLPYWLPGSRPRPSALRRSGLDRLERRRHAPQPLKELPWASISGLSCQSNEELLLKLLRGQHGSLPGKRPEARD